MKFQYLANKYALPFIKNKSTLEVACGKGELGKILKKRQIKYVGLDLIKSPHVDISHDLEKKFPFKDNEFEQIICVDSLEFIGNITQFFQECKRILKENGTLILTLPNSKFYFNVRENHTTFFDYKILRNIFEKNGFKIKKENNFSVIPFFYFNFKSFSRHFSTHFVFHLERV